MNSLWIFVPLCRRPMVHIVGSAVANKFTNDMPLQSLK